VVVVDADGVPTAHVNGEPAVLRRDADGVWRFGADSFGEVRGDGRFAAFDVPIAPAVRYIAMIAATAGDGFDWDHAVFSGARLEIQQNNERRVPRTIPNPQDGRRKDKHDEND
jgi:hypothetical protein